MNHLITKHIEIEARPTRGNFGLAGECGADTPTLNQAREPLPLTDRELEIVLLRGQVLSNRDVDERLTEWVRTVEGHIYKAMAKTGTASREELAALLSQ